MCPQGDRGQVLPRSRRQGISYYVAGWYPGMLLVPQQTASEKEIVDLSDAEGVAGWPEQNVSLQDLTPSPHSAVVRLRVIGG